MQRASKAKRHVDQQYASGQWVYAYRRAPQRSRSLLHSGTTVWVAMLARLRKCNVDQVRPASSLDSLKYQELLRNVGARHAGAVDVGAEGSPLDDACESRVESHEGDAARAEIPDAPDVQDLDGGRDDRVAASSVPGDPAPRRTGLSLDSTAVPSETSSQSEAPPSKTARAEMRAQTIVGMTARLSRVLQT